ncbi:iron uptake transporter deferrochelatase/peroxidase subunit [Nocardioides sp.]|uniref:iron uptake transporter deferrochelatase/peroxidase subunit n=1 Tax=Nocardioides sp. TaxID=35761 RepID=UPI002CDEF696|nr:iron uptake transporter deferrochelatase/peroxidase subunit [Nocardioides sp.]HXH77770.1 iron uptake transporter deferrochelatase/peroxidase subunit [Nocardioides sp.]
MSGLSRRGLLGSLGAAGAGAAAIGFGTGRAVQDGDPASAGPPPTFDLYGEHQTGIVTPVQDRLHLASFDVLTDDREALVGLLRAWTAAAAEMMAGRPAGPDTSTYDRPPDDTGEAVGLPSSRLTITFGFGRSLFDDRFGLAGRLPAGLVDLPHFPGDNLDPARSGGDLCVQACADDPQVAVHAVRNLVRIGFGTVAVRWSQLGFGKTSSTTRDEQTPRNLFGFKDGTMNLKADEQPDLDEHVWVDDGSWLAGGSYLVARRINMTVETWDRQTLQEQEHVIGRTKTTGAPLSGGREHDDPDFVLEGSDGPLVHPDSHVALAHPSANAGVRLLRRGYNFVDGSNALGRLDAGLFFLAYVTDPRSHYIPIQTSISGNDLMQEYVQHTGSALFAVPGGIARGEYVGQRLFA